MSTIAVRPGSDLSYQGEVNFDTEVTEKLKGYEYPLVYVTAYQNGELVYGQLDLPDATFILGGGSSQWVTNGGGAAHCAASLWIYPGLHKGTPRMIAGPVEFDAAA